MRIQHICTRGLASSGAARLSGVESVSRGGQSSEESREEAPADAPVWALSPRQVSINGRVYATAAEAQFAREALELGPYAPKRALRWLYSRYFSHIKLDECWQQQVQQASQEGTVVYVLRSLSFLDFLCLDYLVKRFDMPPIRFVNDLGLWILEPFEKGDRRMSFRRQIPEALALRETLLSNHSALLFLRKPPRVRSMRRRGLPLANELWETLVATQRRLRSPVLLVPQTFVWSKLPPRHEKTWLDAYFGPSEWPGKTRVFLQFVLNYKNALLRSGEPFNVQRFIQEHPHLSNRQLAEKLRMGLLRRMERERALVLGPAQKSSQRMQDELLRSPRLRRFVDAEKRSTGRSFEKVEAAARRELHKLCAAQNASVLAALHRVLGFVWQRIFDGIEIDKEGIERIRVAARRGALIVIPSHRSHVDYLVLSDVFYRNALVPPLIAAGDNLNFFPLGGILRRAGGFFIRRSFRGSKLYPALVDAYLRKLLVEGFTIEFFIEGARSRTGKPLVPKLGLLSMIVDAALRLRGRAVAIAPVAITYERVVEQDAYDAELSGAEKKKENMSDLLRTPAVLTRRYGRLYVQVGEVLAFEDMLAEFRGCHGLKEEDRFSAKQRRMFVQHIASRVMGEIHQSTIVTPTALVATALLAHPGGRVSFAWLEEAARYLLSELDRQGARLAASVQHAVGGPRSDALQQALRLFGDARLVAQRRDGGWTVVDSGRLRLEYYKNTIFHFLAHRSIVALAMMSAGRRWTEHELEHRTQGLFALLHRELPQSCSTNASEAVASTVETFLHQGFVRRVETSGVSGSLGYGESQRGSQRESQRALRAASEIPEGACELEVVQPLWVALQSRIVEPCAQAHLLMAAALERLERARGGMSKKDLVRHALGRGRKLHETQVLRYRESASRAKLEHALEQFAQQGWVKLSDQGQQVSWGERFRGLESLTAMQRQLAQQLGVNWE